MTTSDIPRPGWSATWVAGPDSGRTVTLTPGRQFVGRAAAASVRADDPALEPHHVQLVVGSDGLQITQLAGVTRVTIDVILSIGIPANCQAKE